MDVAFSTMEEMRRKQFAYVCILITTPLLLGFTVVDMLEGDGVEALINLVLAFILVAAYPILKSGGRDALVYRLGLYSLAAIFGYNVMIGSGNGTAIYWLFVFPVVFVFFLGKREGSLAIAVFLTGIMLFLINPFSWDVYPYPLSIAIRFFMSLLLVSIMVWALESSRERYGRLLMEKQVKLEDEKQSLEEALGRIKTLRGLIPICGHCKKIRDDSGYWQQVESYVQKHSDAEFSHGICPDCFQDHYSEDDVSDA